MAEVEKLFGFDARYDKLDVNMKNIFDEPEVFEETMFFINYGETKSLLFSADEIIKVTSYGRETVYEEGRDYVLVDGKLSIPEGSQIPLLTSENYYNFPYSIVRENVGGVHVPVYWGEDETMTKWEIRVTYTHSDKYEGFRQPSNAHIYEGFIKKLVAGKDVTLVCYGDSLTCGATASWYCGVSPYLYSYSMQFACALADLFGYTVKFVDASYLHALIKTPPADYVAGDRGVITYINTAVGGWKSIGGVDNYDKHIRPFVEKYGCDLLISAFGMNDSQYEPIETGKNTKIIVDRTLELAPNASVVIVSTMVPNPRALGWYGNQCEQEKYLLPLAEQYREQGIPCAVMQMTAVSLSVLKRKEFIDYSGNNINHPNDFFIRIYANTLLQTVIGYENLR